MVDIKAVKEKIYRVWDTEEGVGIQVNPDSDGGSYVQISTVDDSSREHYGKIDLIVPINVARLLGEALIACADDIEALHKK